MHRLHPIAATALLAGCPQAAPPPPLGPCDFDRAAIEVAPPDGEFGDLTDGAALWCGNPPQGGAPYTPFRVRLTGPQAWQDGIELEMSAIEAETGVELGWTSLTLGLTCANVGESAGAWVGAEAHLRYNGWNLDELEGRSARLSLRATALGDAELDAATAVDVVLSATAP